MARRSSTFFRLEKNIGDGYKSIYEFHTVVNGNMYIREHEEKNGEERWLGTSKPIYSKEAGNNMYKRLLKSGYKFAGKYEMDILGYKMPLAEEVK